MLAVDRRELVRAVVLIAAGGKFPPKPEVTTQLRAFQDKSLPLEKRAEVARNILYGPKTTVSVDDIQIDPKDLGGDSQDAVIDPVYSY